MLSPATLGYAATLRPAVCLHPAISIIGRRRTPLDARQGDLRNRGISGSANAHSASVRRTYSRWRGGAGRPRGPHSFAGRSGAIRASRASVCVFGPAADRRLGVTHDLMIGGRRAAPRLDRVFNYAYDARACAPHAAVNNCASRHVARQFQTFARALPSRAAASHIFITYTYAISARVEVWVGK